MSFASGKKPSTQAMAAFTAPFISTAARWGMELGLAVIATVFFETGGVGVAAIPFRLVFVSFMPVLLELYSIIAHFRICKEPSVSRFFTSRPGPCHTETWTPRPSLFSISVRSIRS
jgi:hypothetical protein